MSKTMKAVRIHQYGGVDTLQLDDAPRPAAGPGELLIRVAATAANRFDCAARAGYMTGYYPYDMPTILGLDVSGVVDEVGTGVTGFRAGDEVYARTDPSKGGAYAEYTAVAASEAAMKPATLSHIQAAALPHVGLTTWRALVETAGLKQGQTILIHGAAGGVGHFAVQFAKYLGARVIGTASPNNLDFLREIGADEVIDYNTTRFEEVVHDVDAVLDTIGEDTQERSWGVLKPGGVLLAIVQPPDPEKAMAHGVRAQLVGAYPPAGAILKEITTLVDSGQIKPVVSKVLPLQEIQTAHSLLEGRHVRGKIVMQV